mmetsp:Transcript_22145/g.30789  ORF Transcript_22145/g.30789 Transcript_22145/m.30789 type:complete len:416 (+) Transcript_22145:3-1250(+)
MRWHIDLPTCGAAARKASEIISNAVKASGLPFFSTEDVNLGQTYSQKATEVVRSSGCMKFLGLSTGMRLRYLTWGEDERVVILLHDINESSGIMSGFAARLAGRSYKVYALDLRGHGDSSHSAAGQYTPSSLSEDLESFITEKDLYTRPVALVGIGLGAAVAVTFALRHPRLTAMLVVAEWHPWLPVDVQSFHAGQAATFTTTQEAAAFLCSRQWGHPPRSPPAVLKHMEYRCSAVEGEAVRFKMDPEFYLHVTPLDFVEARWQGLQCPLLVVHGQTSHLVSLAEAERVASLSGRGSSASVHTVMNAGHFLIEDSPLDFRNAVLQFLLKNDEALLVHNQEARRPELLGLRPLPEFATVSDAVKALQPRPIPTAQMVEEELAKLRAEDDVQSDEDEYCARRTGLAQDNPEYFAFIG